MQKKDEIPSSEHDISKFRLNESFGSFCRRQTVINKTLQSTRHSSAQRKQWWSPLNCRKAQSICQPRRTGAIRSAIAQIGCHLQRSTTICSAQAQTPKKLIFWQNTGINMTFKQVCSLILNTRSSARIRFMHRLNTSKYNLFGTQTLLHEYRYN